MNQKEGLASNIELNEEEGYILISVNPKIYPLDIIMSAAYILLEEAYVIVDGDIDNEVIVELRCKENKKRLRELGNKFNEELINYSVYKNQAEKNKSIREAIINRVLLTNSATSNDSTEALEYIDDPEGIAIPWEEKYGKDKKNN